MINQQTLVQISVSEAQIATLNQEAFKGLSWVPPGALLVSYL